MSEWKEVKLKNTDCNFLSGYAFKSADYSNKGIPLIKIGNIQNNAVAINDNGTFINADLISDKLSKYLLCDGDILIAMTGQGSVGRVGKLHLPKNQKALLNQRVGKFATSNSELNINYLYYVLSSEPYQEFLFNAGSGSGQPNLSPELILETEIALPPLKEQQAIAEVLASLDDKIDHLHRNNKTLEEMAETLIKESCKSCKTILLGDIIEIYDNKRIPLSSIQRAQKKEGKLYPYYGAATIMDYVNDFIFDGDYILLGEDGTVQTEDGYPVLQRLQGKAWVNNHTHVISAKAPFNNDTLEMILKNTSVSHIVTGAVQPKINQGSLKNLELSVPENNIEDLCLSISTLMSKRENNNKQIGSLSTTRDTLLPKLISGQVRVNI